MAELTDAEIDAALVRGKIAQATEPRAARARYDRKTGQMVVELTNGCTFAFPPRLAQGLATATDDQLVASKSWAMAMGCIGRRWTPIFRFRVSWPASSERERIWPGSPGGRSRPPRRQPRAPTGRRADGLARRTPDRGRQPLPEWWHWQVRMQKRMVASIEPAVGPGVHAAGPRLHSGGDGQVRLEITDYPADRADDPAALAPCLRLLP